MMMMMMMTKRAITMQKMSPMRMMMKKRMRLCLNVNECLMKAGKRNKPK